jgi:multisubunit Na+/H+ antiporter MnhB subunit
MNRPIPPSNIKLPAPSILSLIGGLTLGVVLATTVIALLPALPYAGLFALAYFQEVLMFMLLLGVALGYAARMYHIRYRETGSFRKIGSGN